VIAFEEALNVRLLARCARDLDLDGARLRRYLEDTARQTTGAAATKLYALARLADSVELVPTSAPRPPQTAAGEPDARTADVDRRLARLEAGLGGFVTKTIRVTKRDKDGRMQEGDVVEYVRQPTR
jgi:hypothetical protein